MVIMKNLPFLHSQIVEKVYLDKHQKQVTSIDSLSKVTGYPTNSKILQKIGWRNKNHFFIVNTASYLTLDELAWKLIVKEYKERINQ